MLYEIVSEQLSVKISDVGAEIKSVIFKDKERAWQNESGLWNGCSPVLFPVCGYNSVVIDGTEFDMPRHGFASRSIFVVYEKKNDGITFLLESNDDTKKYYPFAFRLYVKYSVKGNLLVVENIIENIGAIWKRKITFDCNFVSTKATRRKRPYSSPRTSAPEAGR